MLLAIRNVGVTEVSTIFLEENNTIKVVTKTGDIIDLAISVSLDGVENNLLVYQERSKQMAVKQLFTYRTNKYIRHVESSLIKLLEGVVDDYGINKSEFVEGILGLPTELVNIVVDEIMETEGKGKSNLTDLLAQLEEDYIQYGLYLSLVILREESR